MNETGPIGATRENAGVFQRLSAVVLTFRPHQWIKNLIVFAALVFAQSLFDLKSVALAVGAFVAFCLYSGTVYAINDIRDMENDRAHPVKRNRPVASGALSPRGAAVSAIVATLIATGIAYYAINWHFLVIGLIYLAMSFMYSFLLKQVVILDVMVIAIGFILRAVAGAEAIDKPISPWLIICTLFLALFLGFAKRRSEIITLGPHKAGNHRSILDEYSLRFLDPVIFIVTACTIMAYALYACDEEVVSKFGAAYLTIPFATYGVLRYLYLIYHGGMGEDTARILIKDRPIQVSILLWFAVACAVVYLDRI